MMPAEWRYLRPGEGGEGREERGGGEREGGEGGGGRRGRGEGGEGREWGKMSRRMKYG